MAPRNAVLACRSFSQLGNRTGEPAKYKLISTERAFFVGGKSDAGKKAGHIEDALEARHAVWSSARCFEEDADGKWSALSNPVELELAEIIEYVKGYVENGDPIPECALPHDKVGEDIRVPLAAVVPLPAPSSRSTLPARVNSASATPAPRTPAEPAGTATDVITELEKSNGRPRASKEATEFTKKLVYQHYPRAVDANKLDEPKESIVDVAASKLVGRDLASEKTLLLVAWTQGTPCGDKPDHSTAIKDLFRGVIASIVTTAEKSFPKDSGLIKAEVAKAVASINKNKSKSLNKQWVAQTPAWLQRNSKVIVSTAAQQDGVDFPEDVKLAAGLLANAANSAPAANATPAAQHARQVPAGTNSSAALARIPAVVEAEPPARTTPHDCTQSADRQLQQDARSGSGGPSAPANDLEDSEGDAGENHGARGNTVLDDDTAAQQCLVVPLDTACQPVDAPVALGRKKKRSGKDHASRSGKGKKTRSQYAADKGGTTDSTLVPLAA